MFTRARRLGSARNAIGSGRNRWDRGAAIPRAERPSGRLLAQAQVYDRNSLRIQRTATETEYRGSEKNITYGGKRMKRRIET